MPPAIPPVYNVKEPLMLLGTCNEWDPAVASKKHCFKVGPSTRISAESSLRLELPTGEVSFQVVSVRHGWAWRLYPAGDGIARELVDRRHAVGARLAAGENSSSAHGRNFLIRGSRAEVVEIRVTLGGDAKHPSVCLWCTRTPAREGGPQQPVQQQMPEPRGDPSKLGPAATTQPVAKVAPRPAAKPVRPRPPGFSHEELQPLRLVGEFCGWQLEVPGLALEYLGRTVMGEWHEHSLGFVLKGKQIQFQIASDSLGFRWRLFPGVGLPGGRLAKGVLCREAWLGGEKDGHDMNFCIEEPPSTAITLVVRLSSPKGQMPPTAAELLYCTWDTLEGGSRGGFKEPQVAISEGQVSQLSPGGGGNATGLAWSNDPRSFTLDRIEPLRLVGQPCDWRLEQRGLKFNATKASETSGWRAYELCFRMLTKQVDFQVVSDRLGFQWRLFPERDGDASIIPKGTEPKGGLEAKLGGKDDGHGRNFRVRGAPLRVVTVVVWLEEVVHQQAGKSPTAGKAVLTYQAKDKGLQVAIGASRVQHPPRVVTPLGPELLEMAETADEREKVLEMRYAVVRKLCWQLQKEYLAEDVQSEVLALRKLYPYRQQKGALALEMDAAVAISREAANASAPAAPRVTGALANGVEAAEPEVEQRPAAQAPPTAPPAATTASDKAAKPKVELSATPPAPAVPAAPPTPASAPGDQEKLSSIQAEAIRELEEAALQQQLDGLRAKCRNRRQFEAAKLDVIVPVLLPIFEARDVSFEWYAQTVKVLSAEGADKVTQQDQRLEKLMSLGTLGPLELEKGDVVAVFGTWTEEEPLSGQLGIITGFKVETGLYAVQLCQGGDSELGSESLRKLDEKEMWAALQARLLAAAASPEAQAALGERRAAKRGIADALGDEALAPFLGPVFRCLGLEEVGAKWYCEMADIFRAADSGAAERCEQLERQLGATATFPAPTVQHAAAAWQWARAHAHEMQLLKAVGAAGPQAARINGVYAVLEQEEEDSSTQGGAPPFRKMGCREQRLIHTPDGCWCFGGGGPGQRLQGPPQARSEPVEPGTLPTAQLRWRVCVGEGAEEEAQELRVEPLPQVEDGCLRLVDTWANGGESTTFTISRTEEGHLHFSDGGASGLLLPLGPWLHAELRSAVGEERGWLGVVYVEDEDVVISTLRPAGGLSWDEDRVARRATAAQSAAEGEATANAGADLELSFERHEGAISPGGDIMMGRMTLEEAKVTCTRIPHCRGFTFHGQAEEFAVDVFFKDKWELAQPENARGWVSYCIPERLQVAPSPEEEQRRWHCVLGLAVIRNHVQEAQATTEQDEGVAGAKEAHLQLMKRQQTALAKALQDGALSEATDKSQLFGNTEQQYNTAVQHLPSVKAARARAMKKLNLPQDLTLTAIRMGEQRHDLDIVVNEANQLTMKRLRIHSSPHPATMAAAAQALSEGGFFAGTPADWFWGLDTSVHADWTYSRRNVEQCWSAGRFKHWFGGPKAGRYMITSAEELYEWQCMSLFESVILVKDQLQLLITAMGDEGKNLEVEPRVLLAYHANGDMLPPWEDAAGKRSRRLTLTFQLSTGHFKISDGGALRLHRSTTGQKPAAGEGTRQRSGLVAEVPGGGGHWCVFRTHEFKQEVAKVRLPCGRWCITVCAEDAEVARQLRRLPQSDPSSALAECEDNFMAQLEQNCDRCGFAAGDGVVLSCPGNHRLCRACLHREIRREAVPACPACANNGDRVYVTEAWQLFESAGLDELGCVCGEEAVDPGSRVILFGYHRDTQLNGKMAEAIWWDEETHLWEMRIFATGEVRSVHPGCCQLVECCQAGGDLFKCPCWPAGRGIYPVSLGNRCCVKLGIDECSGPIECSMGYPFFHGAEYMPFDSIVTKLEAVIYFLRHNFDHFYHFNNCLDVSPAGFPRIVFHNYRSTMHSFPHHHPLLDQGKLERRVERFRLLCRHSRDVRGARTPLFIRFVGSSEEFAMVEELYSLLRLWAGSRVRLFVVSMLQRPHDKRELLRHASFPRVLFWLVGRVGVLDFTPIREACRFAVHDESGLLKCESVTMDELLRYVRPFTDPYTTKSRDCVETWLNPLDGRDPAFFPDCMKAQLPGQNHAANEELRAAVRKGSIAAVKELLQGRNPADPNTWDTDGRTPLHDLCDPQRCGAPTATTIKLAAELILAHGDPRCHDRAGLEVRSLLRRQAPQSNASARWLLALLEACALGLRVDAEGVHAALEVLGEPNRSHLARVLGLHLLRPIGDAEFTWRNPPPDSESIIATIEEELRTLERLPEIKRKRELKRLLLEWHPDKNAGRLSLATTVFQYLQAQKSKIINR